MRFLLDTNVVSELRKKGRANAGASESLQAATALVHGLTFVTRNVADVDSLDVPLLNPFVE